MEGEVEGEGGEVVGAGGDSRALAAAQHNSAMTAAPTSPAVPTDWLSMSAGTRGSNSSG